jgi:rhomboid protease GluP
MPEKTQTITVNGCTANSLLARAYETFDDLNWTIKYAGENMLIAYTPGKWDHTGEEITVKTNNNELNVTSKMVHGESFDMTGKNKRHIEDFLSVFEKVKASSEELENKWEDKIASLKENTTIIAAEELKQAEEVEKIMKTSSGNLYLTYGIIAINVLVFVAMVIKGVDIISPTGEDIVNWGGNYLPFTVAGDWWRLISCVFVHIGIIHLLFNMYALYSIGTYLEPMLGRIKYITAYLCTGVFASLTSLWWHQTPVASAGASGAIFGMYGVFLALLSTSLIPKAVRKPLLQSIGIFVFYNLAYGMSSGVDNAAHIGGLLSGLVIGYIYYSLLKKNDEGQKQSFQPALIIIATISAAFFYLQSQKPVLEKDDTEKFSSTVEHFNILEEIALESMRFRDTTTQESFLLNLKETALTDWAECVNVLELAEKMDLPPNIETYRNHLIEYSNQRLQQTLFLIKATEEQTDKYKEKIDSIQKKINEVREIIKKEKPSF